MSAAAKNAKAPLSPLLLGGFAIFASLHFSLCLKALRLLFHLESSYGDDADVITGWGRSICLLGIEVRDPICALRGIVI